MKDLHVRLSWARSQAGFNNASDAARYFGWNENTYRSHEGGARGFRGDTAKVYADAFGVNVAWLQYGIGDPRDGAAANPSQVELMEIASKLDAEALQDLLRMARRISK